MARLPARATAVVVTTLAVALLSLSTAGASNEPLTKHGALLHTPSDVVIRVQSPFQSCQVLFDTGDGDCAAVTTANGQLVFTVEPGPRIDDVLVSRPWVVRVWRETHQPGHANEWKVVLATRAQGNDPGPVFADVQAVVGDVTGDGEPELVVGYRSEGTGQILDLDIVGIRGSGVPTVLAHEQLYKGTAKIKHGTLVTWTPVYKKLEANCCPSWIRRDVVRFEHGAFVVHHGKKVPTAEADIPPGDF